MDRKLVVVMKNGAKYEHYKTVHVESSEDIFECLEAMGFFRGRKVNDKNIIMFRTSYGSYVIFDEDCVSSYDFI